MGKRVLLLATKGTIAYSCRPGRSAVASGADLLKTIPADLLAADVVVEDVMAEPGWDMSPATMLGLLAAQDGTEWPGVTPSCLP